jgi:hypothetical protein
MKEPYDDLDWLREEDSFNDDWDDSNHGEDYLGSYPEISSQKNTRQFLGIEYISLTPQKIENLNGAEKRDWDGDLVHRPSFYVVHGLDKYVRACFKKGYVHPFNLNAVKRKLCDLLIFHNVDLPVMDNIGVKGHFGCFFRSKNLERVKKIGEVLLGLGFEAICYRKPLDKLTGLQAYDFYVSVEDMIPQDVAEAVMGVGCFDEVCKDEPRKRYIPLRDDTSSKKKPSVTENKKKLSEKDIENLQSRVEPIVPFDEYKRPEYDFSLNQKERARMIKKGEISDGVFVSKMAHALSSSSKRKKGFFDAVACYFDQYGAKDQTVGDVR